MKKNGNGSINLAVLQFVIYSFFGFIGFLAWVGTSLGFQLGDSYIRGHLTRWTLKFPLWGPFILISSFLSLLAASLLCRQRRLGGYLGILAFMIGFVVNLLFARNLLVHTCVGALIGWTLFVPLLLSWKKLDNSRADLPLEG
jgi:hypothetical protein